MSDITSPEFVALKLMELIASKEVLETKKKVAEPKAYYLALYKECLAAVKGK